MRRRIAFAAQQTRTQLSLFFRENDNGLTPIFLGLYIISIALYTFIETPYKNGLVSYIKEIFLWFISNLLAISGCIALFVGWLAISCFFAMLLHDPDERLGWDFDWRDRIGVGLGAVFTLLIAFALARVVGSIPWIGHRILSALPG